MSISYGYEYKNPILTTKKLEDGRIENIYHTSPLLAPSIGDWKVFYFLAPPKLKPWTRDGPGVWLDGFFHLHPWTRLTVYSNGVDQFTVITHKDEEFTLPSQCHS
jgi:hypothetical protein